MIARPTRAVVVAAGMGRRLAPFTDEMPKCLVPVRGQPMLLRALDHFRAHGVEEIVVVRGYKAEVLEARKAELGPGVRFVENRGFRDNNILQSLFHAADALDGAFLFTYADIVFTRDVVARLMAAEGDVCLIVDRRFRDVYEGRTDHPLPEAEVTSVGPDGFVEKVGKRALPPEEAIGEFIGLAKLSAAGAARFVAAWRELERRYVGREDQPFQRNSWRNAYLTDLLQHMIDAGERMTPVYIDGEWREIDTVQDLTRGEETIDF